jgi:hypothetical protein
MQTISIADQRRGHPQVWSNNESYDLRILWMHMTVLASQVGKRKSATSTAFIRHSLLLGLIGKSHHGSDIRHRRVVHLLLPILTLLMLLVLFVPGGGS